MTLPTSRTSRLARALPLLGLAGLLLSTSGEASVSPAVTASSTKVIVERFTFVSRRPFDAVVAAVDAEVGHPDMSRFRDDVAGAKSYAELQAVVSRAVGSANLMQFLRDDVGGVLAKGRSGAGVKSIRLVLGNPVIMRQMTEALPDAGAYAPVTVLIDERADGVHLSYDTVGSELAPYGAGAASEAAHKVAADLDQKVESLLRRAAG